MGTRFSGTYRMRKVTHTIDDNGFRTSFEVTQRSGANLLGARGLTQTQLDEACGDANTKLPEGFTPLKPCS